MQKGGPIQMGDVAKCPLLLFECITTKTVWKIMDHKNAPIQSFLNIFKNPLLISTEIQQNVF